jgi:Ca-activated chloride channel family protein
MAASIELVAQELRIKEEVSHIILISDGKETCHADPCNAVRSLKDFGVQFTLDLIGFDVSEEERAQLECVAEAGGGRYFPADSADQLHEALQMAEETTPVVKIAQNVEIALDRSLAMNELFEGAPDPPV